MSNILVTGPTGPAEPFILCIRTTPMATAQIVRMIIRVSDFLLGVGCLFNSRSWVPAFTFPSHAVALPRVRRESSRLVPQRAAQR